MTRHLSKFFLALVAVAALALFAAAPGALAQTQPAAPPPANEGQLLEYLKNCPPGQTCQGRVSIPDGRSNVLVSPTGRPFADRMEGWVKRYGGWFLIAVVVLLAAFYVVRGRVRVDGGLAGKSVERFTSVERFGHWLLAVSFIVLAITGLNIRFGRSVLLPITGPETFTWLSQWGKYLHNYASFAFMAGLILVTLMWIGHNFPAKGDLAWIKAGGGILKKGVHPPARKFNFGQKVIFWLVVLGGAALSVTGINLMFDAGTASKTWLAGNIWIHSLVGIALTGVALAHIYIGSIGMEGAFDAMGTGKVDLNWAKEHHSLWVEEMQKSAAPAGAKMQAAE
jgi:formate dehydrogenase subunit gamma